MWNWLKDCQQRRYTVPYHFIPRAAFPNSKSSREKPKTFFENGQCERDSVQALWFFHEKLYCSLEILAENFVMFLTYSLEDICVYGKKIVGILLVCQ
jgi:hypothetical protein